MNTSQITSKSSCFSPWRKENQIEPSPKTYLSLCRERRIPFSSLGANPRTDDASLLVREGSFLIINLLIPQQKSNQYRQMSQKLGFRIELGPFHQKQ
ncbi:hypothetical protein CEXT_44241 [Caerostris extrusa]|uniref:Uncharacterized protein n=1 Tax=Caerostris extrusa TaxID=172846 RepID=A0AAV4PAU0_CAEEX|nr:hypothetical protein CEXT_44241 [Caerostris extrusa]